MAARLRGVLLLASAALAAGGVLMAPPAAPARLAALSPWAVPVSVRVDPAAGGGVAALRVRMCVLNWAAYRADPAGLPMFKDLMTASPDCAAPSEVVWADLEGEYAARGCAGMDEGPAVALGCAPAGLVFHQSRCGSTLAANMLAVLPRSAAYSEANPLLEALMGPGEARLRALPAGERAHALRVLVAAMGRPVAAAAAGAARPPGTAVPPDWAPEATYFKLQSALSTSLPLFRAAFPATPWAFVHRDPTEVLASLFRSIKSPPGSDGSVGGAVGGRGRGAAALALGDAGVFQAPCLRRYRQPLSAHPRFLTAVLGVREGSPEMAKSPAGAGIPPEAYCAAAVAELTASGLAQAAAARRDGFTALGVAAAAASGDGVTPPADVQAAGGLAAAVVDVVDMLDGGAVAAAVASAPGAGLVVHVPESGGRGGLPSGGLLTNATTGRGVVGGVGQGMMLDYGPAEDDDSPDGASPGSGGKEGEALVYAIVAMVRWHMPPPSLAGSASAGGGGSRQLAAAGAARSDFSAAEASMRAVAGRYSKGRNGKMPGWLKWPAAFAPPPRAMDGSGNFVGDAATKRSRSWPALRAAAGVYLSSLRRLALAFNAGSRHALPAAAAAGQRVAAGTPSQPRGRLSSSSTGYDVRMLPLGGGYPATYPLADILTAWNPDVVTVPSHYGRFSSLRVFDGSSPGEMAVAESYRRSEVPFVITNLPLLAPALDRWGNDEALVSMVGADTKFMVEVNEADAHFMYVRGGPPHTGGGKGQGGGGGGGPMSRLAARWRGGGMFRRGGRGLQANETDAAAGRALGDADAGAAAAAAAPADPAHPGRWGPGRPGWEPTTYEAEMTMPQWLERGRGVEATVRGEEAADGALPPGWAAPPKYQAPRSGLNVLDRDPALAKLPGNAAWLAANRRVRLPPPGVGSSTPAVNGGSTIDRAARVFPYGRTLAEYLGGGGADGGDAPPPATAVLPRRAKQTLFYLRASAGAKGMADYSSWVRPSLPIYDPTPRDDRANAFFVPVPSEQRGVHCRLGQPRIMAEAHFDSGRNFIAMMKGRKRYVLSPPSSCGGLDTLRDGPSARHSAADWTSPAGIASVGAAPSLEVVLEPGDVLYVPAFWFHFIVSLTVNGQCNARSGTPPHGLADIETCGMSPRTSEEVGAHTDALPPPSHLLALAEGGVDFGAAAAAVAGKGSGAAAAAPAPLPGRTLLAVSDAATVLYGPGGAGADDAGGDGDGAADELGGGAGGGGNAPPGYTAHHRVAPVSTGLPLSTYAALAAAVAGVGGWQLLWRLRRARLIGPGGGGGGGGVSGVPNGGSSRSALRRDERPALWWLQRRSE